MSVSVLATKLFIPPSRLQVVSRQRLVRQLNEGLSNKLTLVCASAGFGKTTLVSEWIPSVNRPVSWLSLDETDNNSTRFLTYLLAALQTAIPEIGKNIQVELQSPQPPPVESMLTNLLNDIIQIDKPLLLVLDDYHLLNTKSIDDLLTFLLEHMPPQLHLVITTREDPNNLPLARLRARSQLSEIRAADLRFTMAESSEFLKQVMGLELSDMDIAALETRTEGWVAGLQLAALSMKGRSDLPNFVNSFTGSHHFILDYLLQEVLHVQTDGIRSFLLSTAILDRLNGPLCDAVLQHATRSSQKILESIERANLFLIPLDNEHQWYRYHHLFSDVLLVHLAKEQPEKVPVLHLRASEWFEQNAQRPEAIRHALAAKDDERAAGLIELAWPDADRFSFAAPWLAWVKAIPESLVRTRPVLMRNYAQALFFLGKLEEGEHWLRQVEAIFDFTADANKTLELPTGMKVIDQKQFQDLPASVAHSRGHQAVIYGNIDDAIHYAELILKLTPEQDYPKRLEATGMKAFSFLAMGKLDAVFDTFYDNVAVMRKCGLFAESVISVFLLADVRTIQGRLTDVAIMYEESLRLVTKAMHTHPGTSFLYSGVSKLYRERGDQERAAQHLKNSIELDNTAPLQLCKYRIALAQAYEKQCIGELHKSLEILDNAEQLYYPNVVPEFQSVAALKARVWIKIGQLSEALTWTRKRKLSVDDKLSFEHEFDHITFARLLLAQYANEGEENILNQAHSFLARLNEAATTGARFGRLIEILILQALGFQAARDTDKAIGYLQLALSYAEPEGYLQIFADDAKHLEPLFQEAQARGIMQGYVNKILQAFQRLSIQNKVPQVRANASSAHSISADPATTIATSINDTPVEPLSKREMEVLRLVAQGLSNQAISERLFLALSTVKGLNQKIFAKLQVQRRTEAVARARELALL